MSLIIFSHSKNSSDFKAWQNILHGRKLIKKGLMWILGNGSINFWFDNRSEESPFINKIDTNIDISLINRKVGGFITFTKQSNLENLNNILPNYIIEKIKSISIPITEFDDKLT